jgi:hypothetical protein
MERAVEGTASHRPNGERVPTIAADPVTDVDDPPIDESRRLVAARADRIGYPR